MTTHHITESEALRFCSIDESHFFDRKSAQVGGAKVQKALVAFANSDGGELLIGVLDEKEASVIADRWKGAPTIESYNQLIQAIHEVQPPLPVTFTFLKSSLSASYVLKVVTEKSQHVHKTADGKIYERKGAQCLPIVDPQRITQLSFAKGAQSFEDYLVQDALAEDIVESSYTGEFLVEYSPSTDPLDFVISRNLIDRTSFKPRVAGLLLFAKVPSSLIPRKCSVRISRYDTKDEEPDREHLGAIESVEGPLHYLAFKTVERVSAIMSSISIWTTDGPKSLAFPPETILEIIVNAIIHRDFSISDDVHIHIYNNRIEVISPGRFPGYVTKDNVLSARYARNSKIVSILSKYKNAPNKDIGEGLDTAFRKMKEWKMRDPIIEEVGNSVKVTIPHAPLAAPQEAIMEFLEKNSQITNRQARDITGIRSENAMKAEFYKLRDTGVIEMIPELKGNKAAWRKK